MDRTRPLTDESIFPFGKYRGQKMKEVKSDYLDWLDGQAWIKDWPAVKDYIARSRKSIDQDLKREGKI